MKLIKVDLNPSGFCAVCVKCQKRISTKEERTADIDGKPFADYYCMDCSNKLAQEHRSEEYLTCPEDCWCWDAEVAMMKVESHNENH